MKVVILAAGRSKRMQPIPDKNFLLFLGKPLIAHQIDQLLSSGFKEFIIVGGKHNLEKLETLKNEDYKNGQPNIQVIEQKNLDEGMAGAIISCKEFIEDKPLLIVSSNDIVENKAYAEMMKSLQDENFESCLLAKKVSSYFPGGYLETENDGSVINIIEKPGEGNEPSDLVNIVVHCHKNPIKLIETLENISTEKDDRYEVALDTLIKNGTKIKAHEYDGHWQSIKYPWDIFRIMDYFSAQESHISKNAEIADTAVIKGHVIIDDGAKIFENAVISGPCYIGKNVVVANNALVRNSMVNANSVIGFSTEIARSYIGENVWTHKNYIGDSIISDNCSFGSGTVTANLRLDEKPVSVNIQGAKTSSGEIKFGLITGENIRCGINTSFMPGVKIGSNSLIGAGIIIPHDIDENSFVVGKVELDIRENKAALNSESREKMRDKID